MGGRFAGRFRAAGAAEVRGGGDAVEAVGRGPARVPGAAGVHAAERDGWGGVSLRRLRVAWLAQCRNWHIIDSIWDKELVWLHGEVKSPPFSPAGRLEAGFHLRRLQRGELLAMPHSRSMPSVGQRCHELRITDAQRSWRIVYRVDDDAIVIAAVFEKRTQTTPRHVIDTCKRRFSIYDSAARSE